MLLLTLCVYGFCVGSFYCNIRLGILSSFVGNCGGNLADIFTLLCY